jgi:lycopene cyclase domain-containing protein
MKYLYLAVNAASLIVPLIFSFHPKIKFYRELKYFLPACLITSLLFLAGDVWFTHIGIWQFNPEYVTGIYFFNLPLEEVLFFICIPYACVFTYHSFDVLFGSKAGFKNPKIISLIFIFLLSSTGIFYFEKTYTSITFLLLAFIIFLVHFILKAEWIGRFYLVYLVLLIPFFIVNGILTGTGPDNPVVVYNNSENLGLRLFTIPVEDVFYGMELILLNILFFEQFKKIANRK